MGSASDSSRPSEPAGASRDTRSPFTAPAISLPKGGGAIRGIGEKFAANPVTGSASFSIPIATSPGRSGFGPQLTLAYDSAAGNGPFGYGWSLSLPAITRKTDKGLPQYQDAADGTEPDVFVLSGAEDLVPMLAFNGRDWSRELPRVRAVKGETYAVTRYRPRTEGLFARIERWTNVAEPTDVFWRSISRDNVTTWYGRTSESRISDPNPERAERIFSWLICESYDDKGNAIVYSYAAEDSEGVDPLSASEQGRERRANRYIKRIRYGNETSRLVEPDLSRATWLFDVVFDYDEGHYRDLPPDPARPVDEQHAFAQAAVAIPGVPRWTARPDPFSVHRASFEVRTHRRCHRVLMFHNFRELAPEPCLVSATLFDYADFDYAGFDAADPVNGASERAHRGSTRIASFIQSATHAGFVRDPSHPVDVRDGISYFTYLRQSLPPVELEYSRAIVHDEVRDVDAQSLENLPSGVDAGTWQFVDLDSEGLSGILTQQGTAWFYKPSLGNGRFGPPAAIATIPSTAELHSGDQLLDLAGDGQLDLVSFSGAAPGFFERTPARGWEPHRSFRSLPHLRWDDPNLRFVDLNGDGHADVLITEQDAFVWHPSLGEDGFGPAVRTPQAADEAHGPRLVFADGTQSIYVADMCGDGLNDLVRVRNGEVCYWPSLGYGHFGARVAMDDAPAFDRPDQFDHRRVRLADIDGSGTTDILYLGADGVRLYFNQSGNRWSGAHRLLSLPPVDSLTSVTTADLLGNGTACLVWSSPLPDHTRRAMRFIDLMGGQKPHLLVRTANNLGAETVVHYAASTRFYLEDKEQGEPWITRLPFPVHVVERVETFDHVSRNRFVTRYAYHHGYFDGEEREFRGFGMVEQWDTEEFAALEGEQPRPAASNEDLVSHVPPVHTKTWFHTGAYLRGEELSRFFARLAQGAHAHEYYREPAWRDDDEEAAKHLLPDTVLPKGLTLDEEGEVCRALKGMMLRQEVYGLDGTPAAEHPYTVKEQSFAVECLQPRLDNRHGVFVTHPAEAIAHHYERNPDDPRTAHTITLEVDAFGNITKAVAVAYGRRKASDLPLPSDRARQTTPLLTYTESDFTRPLLDLPDDYRAPMPAETRTYELTGYAATGDDRRFIVADFVTPDDAPAGVARRLLVAGNLDYEQEPTAGKERRLIECVRTLYRANDLTALSPLGILESLALPGESYKLAFTAGLIDQIFRRPLDQIRPPGAPPPEVLLPAPAGVLGSTGPDGGGYSDLDGDGNWWAPSGRVFYSEKDADAGESRAASEHFYLPRRYRDPFGFDTVVRHDTHDLLVTETIDAVGNRVIAAALKTDGSIDPALPGHDYRVLQPCLVTDTNRNRTAVAFDALGLVAGTALSGKDETVGDRLVAFEANLTRAQLDDLYDAADPTGSARKLLQDATARIVYDPCRFKRSRTARPEDASKWDPVFACTVARETHASDPVPARGLRIQVTFSYSDGLAREIQKKIPAEPGPVVPGGLSVAPRWVGSGWTIFNNKGQAVRQFEPFFSQLAVRRHRYEFDARAGVSSVVFHDPAGRVIATVHPNHTYEKVVFDAWMQRTFDTNDTVAPHGVETGDPRTDPDIRGYVAAYFKTLGPWETWHQRRMRLSPTDGERIAAIKAAAHANTPSADCSDVLGRNFLTHRHNGYEPDGVTPIVIASRLELDIEGNEIAARDAITQDGDPRGRLVMRYRYDLLGNRVHQASMEAGERWTLNDVLGRPIRGWDTAGRGYRNEYDRLRRQVRAFVRGIDLASPAEAMTERILYGEHHPNAELQNLRGRPFLHLDQSGAVTSVAHDFKGNVLQAERRLLREFKTHTDWTGLAAAFATDAAAKVNLAALDAALAPMVEPDTFVSTTKYDALNRPVRLIAPHRGLPGGRRNVIQPVFNEANLLERIDVWLDAAEPAGLLDPAVTPPSRVGIDNIDYDAKGQRVLVEYKNGARTRYSYDPETFRLRDLYTWRGPAFTGDCDNPSPPPLTIAAPDSPPSGRWCGLQRLHYTYDPAGNVTAIDDAAQQSVYFRNQRVDPDAHYTYDPLYRLIAATGREHLGQIGGTPIPYAHDDGPRTAVDLAASDGGAMGRYLEEYVYDAVGNFESMKHRGTDPAHAGWTRACTHDQPSLLEQRKRNNRLSQSVLSGPAAVPERYLHDAHGNITRMPHLENHADPLAGNMHWDFNDRLRRVDLGGGGTVWYVYDSTGVRTRKVWEKPGLVEERIYLGGLEVFRQIASTGTLIVERETLQVMDDKRRIALVETRTAGLDAAPSALIRYQFGNHLGSSSLELDDQAAIVSYEEYSPYGTTTFQAVRSTTETPKRYRYTGKERDQESGLYYHGARYYAPWLGSWIACDALGIGGELNLYRYCRNSPLGLVDTNGREPFDPQAGHGFVKWLLYGTDTPVRDAITNDRNLEKAQYAAAAVAIVAVTVATGGAAAEVAVALGAGPAGAAATAAIVGGGVYRGEVALAKGATPKEAAARAADPEAIVDSVILAGAPEPPPGSLSARTGPPLGPKAPNTSPATGAGKTPAPATAMAPAIAAKPKPSRPAGTTPKAAQSAASASPAGPPTASADLKPDVPTQAIIPIDQVATRRGEAFAPKVNPKPGAYRGVTPKMRAEAQRVGEKYQGPGEYDVGHRVPLSQVPPGAKVRFRSEGANPNRADGDAIAESNVARKRVGLYTRY